MLMSFFCGGGGGGGNSVNDQKAHKCSPKQCLGITDLYEERNLLCGVMVVLCGLARSDCPGLKGEVAT